MIRPPHPHEIKRLPDIENEADRRYARVGLHRVIAMPPASVASLEYGRWPHRRRAGQSALP